MSPSVALLMADPPRLLVETIIPPGSTLSPDMVCDIDQVAYLLVKAVLRVARLTEVGTPIIQIQLHPTVLQFKQADGIDSRLPAFIDFGAVAVVISQAMATSELLPKVKACYGDIDAIKAQRQNDGGPSIDLEQDTISTMVRAHYGHFEASVDPQQPSILLVLPTNLTHRGIKDL